MSVKVAVDLIVVFFFFRIIVVAWRHTFRYF